MLHLRSLFNASRVNPPAEPRPRATSDVTLLRAAGSEAAVLEKIRRSRTALGIRIAGSDQTYTSTLIGVSRADGYLLIDELVPRSGNTLISQNTFLDISAFFSGALIEFSARVQTINLEDHLPILRLDFPEVIAIRQRRQYHRVSLPANGAVPVHLQVESEKFITGGLRNISTGGLCVLLNRQVSGLLRVGQTISRCVIHAEPEARIVAGLELRSSLRASDRNFRSYGGMFVGLDSKNLQALQQLVVTLDRKEARSRTD
jgi:c-di-GMP-binding flagellar brake protein YcgR